MGLVFWSMGAISPRLYTVPFQQEPALGQWSLVLLGTAANCGMHNLQTGLLAVNYSGHATQAWQK